MDVSLILWILLSRVWSIDKEVKFLVRERLLGA